MDSVVSRKVHGRSHGIGTLYVNSITIYCHGVGELITISRRSCCFSHYYNNNSWGDTDMGVESINAHSGLSCWNLRTPEGVTARSYLIVITVVEGRLDTQGGICGNFACQ